MLLKIGELAKRIGVTVRTLHHYDAIGLVKPSARSEAGYRLYDRSDVARLHRIQALRGLGLSLAETGIMLDGDGADLRAVIRQQISGIEQQLTRAAALRDRLTALDAQLAGDNEPDLDEWLATLGMMATRSKYFTDEDIAALHRRMDRRTFNARWAPMVTEVRALMDRGVPPQCAEAKEVSERWLQLAEQSMGDDPRFFVKLSAMHRTELGVQAETGVDGAMLDYISAAGYAIRCDLYARYVTAQELKKYRSNYAKKNMEVWLALFVETRHLMERGVAAGHPDATELFERWDALFRGTWGDDPETRARVRKAHRSEPRILAGSGFTSAMQEYIDEGVTSLLTGHKNRKQT